MSSRKTPSPFSATADGQPTDTRTLYIDYSKCIGCETCESVCKFLYTQPRIVMIRTLEGLMVPLYCRHCETPHCMKVCRYGALNRDDAGAVILSPLNCRACSTKNCILGCPYGGMLATGEGIGVNKCDLCAGRRKAGELPACVEMCPCGAIMYVEREQIAALQSDASRAAEARVLAHIRPKAEE